MDSILIVLVICLLIANLVAVILLFKRKQPEQIDSSLLFKDEVNSLKHSLKFSTGLLNNHFEISGRLSKITSDGYVERASSDLKSSTSINRVYFLSLSSSRGDLTSYLIIYYFLRIVKQKNP